MGHHDNDNDARREERIDQEKHRQKLRDESLDENLGSQDERRKEGDEKH